MSSKKFLPVNKNAQAETIWRLQCRAKGERPLKCLPLPERSNIGPVEQAHDQDFSAHPVEN
jgi:hypothetical protein